MPSSAATLAALRPLLRHNSSACFLYSSVYLALLRDGLLNCVFMWASFRVLTLCPLSVKSMQPYSDPFLMPDCQMFRGRRIINKPAITAIKLRPRDHILVSA